jgi:hypothetical protein
VPVGGVNVCQGISKAITGHGFFIASLTSLSFAAVRGNFFLGPVRHLSAATASDSQECTNGFLGGCKRHFVSKSLQKFLYSAISPICVSLLKFKFPIPLFILDSTFMNPNVWTNLLTSIVFHCIYQSVRQCVRTWF